MWTKED
jgi:hypothetical protein